MKMSNKIAALAVMAFTSSSAFATELNVEIADVTSSDMNVEVNDIAMPIAGLDLDVELTRGDATNVVAGLDYVVDTADADGIKPFALDVGAEFDSDNKDILFEANGSKKFGDFKPYVKLDYSMVDSGTNNGDYTAGVEYSGVNDLVLGVSYNNEFTGADVDDVEFSAVYLFDDRLTGEVTHTLERNAGTESTEVVGNYAFNKDLYTAVTYTFEETKDDTFGIEVGYKF